MGTTVTENRFVVTVTDNVISVTTVGIQGIVGPQGPVGVGFPVGGTANQVLSKIDAIDYNTTWADPSALTSLNDLSDVTTINPVSGDVLVYGGSPGVFTNRPLVKADVVDFNDADYATSAQGALADSATQPLDNVSTLTNDAGYLTSFTETNDLTASVTWANVPDVNITETSVTQHEAALSIASTQITGETWISDITAESIGDLSDVTNTTPVTGDVLVYGGSPGVFTNRALVKADVSDFNDADYATSAQGTLADSATQPLDNISTLTNDAGYLTSFIESDPVFLAQKGTANGVATLGSDSKIPSSQIPVSAITNTFVVASEVEMLALGTGSPIPAETGDVAVRTDLNESFILQGTDASVLGDWIKLLTPTDAVLSVNAQTGTVVLTTTNINEGTNLYYTEVRVSANTDVAANTTARHTHANSLVLNATTASFLLADETKLDGLVSNVTTNLGYTASPTNGVVTSSDGTNATLTLATSVNAGLMTPADFDQIALTSGTNTGDQDLSAYDTHIADATKHRLINDAGTTTTELFSASKIISDLSGKSDTSHVHEGIEIDATAITDGFVLTADGAGNSVWEATAIVLNDLSDVALGSPILHEALVYDGSNWVNDIGVQQWMSVNSGSTITTLPIATGTDAVAIGDASTATGTDSVGIGSTARATGFGSISIGAGSLANTSNVGMAIGFAAQAISTSNGCAAIGWTVINTISHSIRIGNETTNTNILHLKDEGNLTLEGTKAQFVQPNYTTAALPNGTLGGTVYDTTTNELKVYTGATWDSIASAAEVNDLTASVTWANVPDANITQTSVTQHEAALSITESQVSDLGTYATQDATINTKTASYTLILTDADTKIVEMNVATANNLTVPPNSSVAFPTGTKIDIVQYGTGVTTVVQGAGVTIRTAETLVLDGQYSGATLYKRATDEWVLIGRLVAA